MSFDPMPREFEELAEYNGQVADGIGHPLEYAARMADLQTQFNAWHEWQLRRGGFRSEELPGHGTIWVKEPTP